MPIQYPIMRRPTLIALLCATVLGCGISRGELRGQVLDPAGMPRAGAEIAVFPVEPLRLDTLTWARADR